MSNSSANVAFQASELVRVFSPRAGWTLEDVFGDLAVLDGDWEHFAGDFLVFVEEFAFFLLVAGL